MRALFVGLAFLIAFAQGFGLWHRTMHGMRLDAAVAELAVASASTVMQFGDSVRRDAFANDNPRTSGATASNKAAAAFASNRDTPFDHNDIECKLLDALVLAAFCATVFVIFGLRFSRAVYALPGSTPVVRITHYAPFHSRAPPGTSTR